MSIITEYVPTPMDNIQTLVTQFANNLTLLIEANAGERARAAVESALGGGAGARRPGRPPKTLSLSLGAKLRKKAPRQLCPVPGCKNTAAPIFGMVCAKHKDVAKAKIKKYREARRAKKLKARA